MHKIFDLREMDIEQLRSLAEELNVKGFKKMEKDDLVYAVLDEEAKQNALKAPEKKEKPKRGRPRKEADAPKAEPKKEEVKKEEPKKQDFTSKQMLCRPSFWMAFLCISFLAAVGSSVISFAKDLVLSVNAPER